MASLPGVHVLSHPARSPDSGGDGRPWTVVLVHGSLDRAASFVRVVRRLPEFDLLTYDRRGYQRSRRGGVVGITGHVADLVALARSLDPPSGLTAVGHSLGGAVVIGAALAQPALFDSIGAYEPPLRWLGFVPPDSTALGGAEDPAGAAEAFFRRMVGDDAWERLPAAARDDRRADGPALAAELTELRGPPLFDITALGVPAVFARGGDRSARHHRDGVDWVVGHVPSAQRFEIAEAGHGAHLSHPDAFAALVRRAVASGRRAKSRAPTPPV